MQRKPSKLPLIVGVVFIVAAGIAIFGILKGVQDSVTVMTATQNLPAYSFVDSSDLEATAVPQASVTPNDLTEDEFVDQYDSEIAILGPVLAGQRIDKRYIPEAKNASFAVVLPDERVVAATSTVAGAAVGTIQAGDVVDVNSESSGISSSAATSSFAKVLCIATQPSGCQGVLPPGVKINADDSDSGSSRSTSDSPVIVLLAVPQEDAAGISGQSVTLALDPFCRVDNSGYFFSPREADGEDFLCKAPSDRLASRGPQSEQQTSPDGKPSE